MVTSNCKQDDKDDDDALGASSIQIVKPTSRPHSFLLRRESDLILGSNNIEGKITECWLVNEEGIFFS